MIRRVYDTSLKLSFMALLLIIPQLAHSVVLWHDLADLACPGGNPGITMDVTDEDIDVMGTNAIFGPIRVTAATQDVLITITNNDSVITGSERCDGMPTPEPRLYLQADTGRTITVCLTHDLLFRGTAQVLLPQDILQDLLVAVVGDGTVVFQLDGSDTNVTFGSLPTSGGTQVYVGMNNNAFPNFPLLRFERKNTNSSDNVEVVVGDRSCVTFISNVANGQGLLEFRPTNQSPIGMLILRINPCGSFIIAGHQLNAGLLTDFVIGDVDLTTANGMNAFAGIADNTAVANGINAFRVINENFCCTDLFIEPFCDNTLTATKAGFILGPHGVLDLQDETYLDYIGTASNVCCTFTTQDDCGITFTDSRLRNGSAFIVDAESDDPADAPIIRLNNRSGIFFRSGIDKCGEVDEANDFVINAGDKKFNRFKTDCVGNIVFDIEGPLVIEGDLDNSTPLGGIQVLSLQVTKTGCPILVNGGGPALFPERTFNRNNLDEYLRYNSAGVLVNNALYFEQTALVHTDQNHDVFEEGNLGNGALSSEPTYIGGDTFELCKFQPDRTRCRPFMSFFNSEFRVHTSVASTGVDLRVSNNNQKIANGDNNSRFLFYNNGRCIDDGSGRNMILGTNPCFDPCGCCFASLDKDSHLDVMQTTDTEDEVITLSLETRFNTTCIIEGIVEGAAGCAIQTIYLNNSSNISIGTLPVSDNQGVDCFGDNFDLTEPAGLFINGACFSFETAGGVLRYPQSSGTTGQGGIFVDTNGTFRDVRVDGRPYIANIGAMVTKSGDGVVDLPKEAVFFDSRVGIQDWRLDLNDPNNRVIVAQGQCLSDYTLDWENVKKELCCTNDSSLTCFRPYEIKELPLPCDCPPVTHQNLTALPCVEGIVDQFQVVRSRICDPMHLKVDGGKIREMTFLVGFNSAEAPVAFIVIEGDGEVGLGSANLNRDSNCANIVLGVNGVQVVANGDSNVVLNQDVLINNVCHILSGTSFGVDGPETLKIYSPVPRELRIKSSGTLDLTQFDNENKLLEIGGQVLLLAEPGARIILNGGTLLFSDEARFELDQVLDLEALIGATSVSDTDSVRVVMSGQGRVEFTENSSMFVQQDSYFGIETYDQCSDITTITFSLLDQASVQIGTEESPGGSFQIGNTMFRTFHQVNFFLIQGGSGVFGSSGGRGTVFQVDRQGFFGMDVGIVDKLSQIPNLWSVGNLWNVGTIGIDIQEGRFRHDQIISGDNARASLIAIGDEGTYNFTFAPVITDINGGGNLVRIAGATSINPAVGNFAGTVVGPNGTLSTNIMSGRYLLEDANKPLQPQVGLTSAALFTYLSTLDFDAMSTPRANFASEQLNIGTMGYIRMTSIIERFDIIQGTIGTVGGSPTEMDHSIEIGAVGFNLAPANNAVSGIDEIIGSVV